MTVQIIFPDVPLGTQNAVDTVAELRALDSTEVNINTEVLVASMGFYKFDPSSLAVDDGSTILKPDDLTVLQAGRWEVVLSGSAALTSFTQSGTGAVATTVEDKLGEMVSVLDFIPAVEHAAIIAKSSTYDCGAAFAAAHAAHADVTVPYGKYHLAAMLEVGLGGVGQRGFTLQQGAEVCRLSVANGGSAATTPVVWLKSDQCFFKGVGLGARVYSQNRSPDGVILIGHRDMTVSHANVMDCDVSGLNILGLVDYGSTSGNPDVGIKVCNPQIASIASYYHRLHNLRIEAVNYGILLQGWANGCFIHDIDFWHVGNATLATARAAIYFQGAQESQIHRIFFHSSPGSTCFKFEVLDNTANPGGSVHTPINNYAQGISEQDPAPSGGLGVVMNANCVGVIANRIDLIDNCPANDISATAYLNNFIRLMAGDHTPGAMAVNGALSATGLATFTGAYAQAAKFLTTTGGLGIQTGANRRTGTAVLVAGTVTVANTSIAAGDGIFLERSTTGGTPGHLSTTRINGTSFTINSSAGADTSTIEWMLLERY